MLKIGNKIVLSHTESGCTQVYFNSLLVKGVQHIEMKFSAGELPYQECSVIVTNNQDAIHTMMFAEEMAECGINTEVLCMYGEFKQIEVAMKGGSICKDVKIPILVER